MKGKIGLQLKPLKTFGSGMIVYIYIIFLASTQVLLLLINNSIINISTAQQKSITSVFLTISLLALLLLFGYFKSVRKSMNVLIKSAKQLSEGNLNINDIIISEYNDFRILAKAFNVMKANLLFFIDNTKKNVTTLSDAIDKVYLSMDMTSKGNEQISTNIENIADKSHEQLKLVEDTLSRMNDMYKSIDNISLHIDDVEKLISISNGISIEGRENLNAYSENIEVIFGSMLNTGDFISKLRNSISEITNVINFILEISNQLNLLSLNASIEAARSGEAGKGFTIVANEITKLSENTKAEISKIDLIISNVLENSTNVENSIKKSITDFDNSSKHFLSTKQIFNDIYNKNSTILNQINDIVSEVSKINAISKTTSIMNKKVYDSSASVSEGTNGIVTVIQEEFVQFQEINQTVLSLQGHVEKISKLSSIFSTGISPVNNIPSKHLKIAFIILSGNQFWSMVHEGLSYVKRELSTKNTTVEIIPIYFKNKDHKDTYLETIYKCIDEKYDGICVVAYDDRFIQAVDKAVEKGVSVITVNNDFLSNSKRMSCVRQNPLMSGAIAAEKMAKSIEGGGRILLIENDNSTSEFKLRIKGFEDSIKNNKNIKIVDRINIGATEEETISILRNYLKHNSSNINGIFLAATFKIQIAQVIEELGLGGKIKYIVYDIDTKTCNYIKKGVITCALGQDPFRQGYDPVIYLYNYLVAGKKPENEKIWTRIEVVDIENVNHILS